LTITLNGNDWVVTPVNSSLDDVTYTFKVTAANGCFHYDGMNTSFILHVGCPSAATSSNFTLGDYASGSAITLFPN